MRIPPGYWPIPARGAGIKGVMVIKTINGKTFASAWPRSQKAPRTPAEAANRETLYWSTQIVKIMDAYQQDFSYRLAQQTQLARNDFLYISLFGRIGTLIRADGRKIFSMAAMQDVSKTLDAIWQTKNGLLVRGDTWWEGLAGGAAGQQLIIGLDGKPAWSTPAPVAGGKDPFFYPMPLRPDIAPNFNPGFFAAISISPVADIGTTGLKVWFNTAGTGKSIVAAIYQTASVNTMTGAALVRQSTAQTLVPGMNTIPWTSPRTLLAERFYWLGIATFGGTGTPTILGTDQTRNGFFFAQTTGTMPSLAPASTPSGAGQNFNWWLY